MPKKFRIVSGGQTGADQAALDAALELGIDCGGWCPEDRASEAGPIPDKYPVVPLPGAGYRQRTRQNVIDSDATVIISFGAPDGGTRTTVVYCQKKGKPHLIIDAEITSALEASRQIKRFVKANHIATLNVAGPRASKHPAIYQYVYETISKAVQPRSSRGKQ